MGTGVVHRDRWLSGFRENAMRAGNSPKLKLSKKELDVLLNSEVEVLAYEDGTIAVMRMPAEELEHCLIEYRHIPWRVLSIRPLLARTVCDRR